MNTYRFSDLSVGLSEQFETTITEEMMKSFLAITGDVNPFHNDEEFAKRMGHSGKVVYGMLTASFLSTLAGVYLPGERSIIHEVTTKFAKPVHIGDTLTIKGTVSELNESVQQMVMKVEIRNQENLKVLKGQMKIGFLDER